jgi:hypothetical protein
MKDLSKRSHRLQQGIYCAHCFVRIGPGERQVVRDGKPYHAQCEAKCGKGPAAALYGDRRQG